VIVAGYLGLALVVGVSAALVVVVAGRAPPRARLFLRCLRWGTATGAVTGAVVGAMLVLVSGLDNAGLTSVGLIYGAIVGGLVSLIPTLIGTVFITDVLARRHPFPSSTDDVRGDLTAAFQVVVAVLDVALFVALIVSGVGLSSIAVALPFIVVGNGCVALMLWRARWSIARLWSSATA
jgi:hypothetical protein